MKRQREFSILAATFTLVLVFALSACNSDQQTALGGTRAWIDVPRDRSVISLTPHAVTAHASDAAGLQLVTLVVNGATVGAMKCENLAQPLVTCRLDWTPAVPGDYRLEASAANRNGAVVPSNPVFITVGEKLVSPTPTGPARGSTEIPKPSDVPTRPPRYITRTPTLAAPTFATLTPVPRDATITPSHTPTRTSTPTPTSTSGPVCPGAPVISSFTASSGKITQGQTSTLSWGLVSNATSVEIDRGIGGVATPGSRVVSPSTTTTYTLTARGCGGTATRQVTILVTAPPTPTFTHTPVLDEPAAPSNLRRLSRACSSPDQIRIAWNDNSNNESGFRIYRRIRSDNTWTAWSQRATVGANSSQYTDVSGLSKFDDVEYGVEAYNVAGTSARPTLSVSECID